MRADLYTSMRRGGIDPTTLDALHRIILTTDGTVTDILEAYCREPMRIVLLRQDMTPGRILDREVLLRGADTGRCHVYARSLIAIEQLPTALRQGLVEQTQAIGHLLFAERIETFKEIVDCHRERAGALAHHFGVPATASLLSRTYVLYVREQRIMVINEKFLEARRDDR